MVSNFAKYCSSLLISGLLLIVLSVTTIADDKNRDPWPQYRGPNRDGIAHSKELLKSWPENGPKLVWKKPIGDGFSGISISEGKMYTMFAEDSVDYLVCFDEKDAKELWRLDVGKMFISEFGNGPRSTPTLDGDVVYALSSNGNLYAANKNSGKTIWTVTFKELFETKTPIRGFSVSPLIDENLLITDVGGGKNEAVAAFDKRTGKVLWTALSSNPNYSSPVAVNFNEVRQFIFVLSGRVVSISTKGDSLWSMPVKKGVVAMPIYIAPDKLFISSAIDAGCSLIKMVAANDSIQTEEVWSNSVLNNHFNSSVYYNNHLYGFSNATLKCVDVETGKQKWAKRGYGKGSLILSEEHFIVLSDRGRLALIEATSESYNEISRFQAIKGKSWTSPTLVDGKLYLRNRTEMACFDIGN